MSIDGCTAEGRNVSPRRPSRRALYSRTISQTPRGGVATVAGAAFFSLCVSAAVANGLAAEPRNLDLLKRELRDFHDSGEYDREISKVTGEARLWIEQRVERRKPNERLAVVFDFDETLVSNWPTFRVGDFGYVEEKWLAWVQAAEAPPLPPVVDLLKFVQARGLDVFVITSRTENQRTATARNLERIGCADNVRLICAPDDSHDTAAKFKTAQRQQLAKDGYVLIANVGDQQSDLVGGNAERTFKLPNPFYLTE